MTYYIILFSLAILLGIIVAMFNLPFWIAIAIIIIISVVNLGYILHIMYRSQNMDTVSKYLMKNQKNPIFAYTYAMAKGSSIEINEALAAVLAKYKSPYIQTVYKMNYAIWHADYEQARLEAMSIKDKPLGQYGMALIYSLQGDQEKTNTITLKRNWQKLCIDAILAYKEQSSDYEEKKQLALKASKGIQLFLNYYFFDRLEKEKL